MVDEWSDTDSVAAVSSLTPDAWRSWQQLDAVIWTVADTDLVDVARTVCAQALGLDPLPRPAGMPEGVATADPDGTEPECARIVRQFAEQFSIDVSGIDESARAELLTEVGATAFDLVQAVFVADYSPRARRALDELFGPSSSGWPAPPPLDPTVAIWPVLEDFMDTVIHIRALDAVTREVVRLRGARQHQCRLCQSRRSTEALAAGADEDLFDAIDHAEDSSLSTRHRAALALVDAMVWQPAHLPVEVLDGVRANYTPVEAIDLVLNVMRNAMNKIAVALAADAPNVTEGVEIYEVDPVS